MQGARAAADALSYVECFVGGLTRSWGALFSTPRLADWRRTADSRQCSLSSIETEAMLALPLASLPPPVRRLSTAHCCHLYSSVKCHTETGFES